MPRTRPVTCQLPAVTSTALDPFAPGAGAAGCGLAAGFESADTRDPLGLLDLFRDPFVRDPYPWLDLLRSQPPVHHDPATGLWVVPDNAKHAVSPLPVAVLRVLARVGFTLPPALANNATLSHSGLRRVVTRFLTRRVAQPPCR